MAKKPTNKTPEGNGDQPVTRASIMMGRLRAKNLGNPKVAAGFSDAEMAQGKQHALGTILGRASGTKEHKDPADDTKVSYSLVGFFQGVPADPSMPIIKSGVCWLPGGIHELVTSQVEAAEGGIVEFAFQIYTQRAGNKAGYEYVTQALISAETADPLADLRTKVLALPAP